MTAGKGRWCEVVQLDDTNIDYALLLARYHTLNNGGLHFFLKLMLWFMNLVLNLYNEVWHSVIDEYILHLS